MAKGTEIIDYKNRILKDILHNEDEQLSREIVETIDTSYVGSEDDLVYENVFPYLHIPKTQDEVKSFIMMSVDMPKVSTKNYFFKNMVITINCVVHEDLMKMPARYSATRVDYLASLINKVFNGSKNYGTVALEYVSDTESILLDRYFVRSLRFTCNELNSIKC